MLVVRFEVRCQTRKTEEVAAAMAAVVEAARKQRRGSCWAKVTSSSCRPFP